MLAGPEQFSKPSFFQISVMTLQRVCSDSAVNSIAPNKASKGKRACQGCYCCLTRKCHLPSETALITHSKKGEKLLISELKLERTLLPDKLRREKGDKSNRSQTRHRQATSFRLQQQEKTGSEARGPEERELQRMIPWSSNSVKDHVLWTAFPSASLHTHRCSGEQLKTSLFPWYGWGGDLPAYTTSSWLWPQVAGNDKLLISPSLQRTQPLECFAEVCHRTAHNIYPLKKQQENPQTFHFAYYYTKQQQTHHNTWIQEGKLFWRAWHLTAH